MAKFLNFTILLGLLLTAVACGNDEPKEQLSAEASKFVGTWHCKVTDKNQQHTFLEECMPTLYFDADGKCGGELGTTIGDWYEDYSWSFDKATSTITTDIYMDMAQSHLFNWVHVSFIDITWIDNNTWQGYLNPNQPQDLRAPSEVYSIPYTFVRSQD